MTTAPPRPPSSWTYVDQLVTSVLLALYLTLFQFAVWISFAFAFVSANCPADSACSDTGLHLGWAVNGLGGLIVLVSAIVFAAKRMNRGAIAFWVPILGAVIQILLFATGWALAINGYS